MVGSAARAGREAADGLPRVGCRRARARLPRRAPRGRRDRAGAGRPAALAAAARRARRAGLRDQRLHARAPRATSWWRSTTRPARAPAGTRSSTWSWPAGRASRSTARSSTPRRARACSCRTRAWCARPSPPSPRPRCSPSAARSASPTASPPGSTSSAPRRTPRPATGSRAAAVAAEGLAEHPEQRGAALQPRLLRGAGRAPRRRPRPPARGGGRRPGARARVGRGGRRPRPAPRPHGLSRLKPALGWRAWPTTPR